jgi:hypothetical protein
MILIRYFGGQVPGGQPGPTTEAGPEATGASTVSPTHTMKHSNQVNQTRTLGATRTKTLGAMASTAASTAASPTVPWLSSSRPSKHATSQWFRKGAYRTSDEGLIPNKTVGLAPKWALRNFARILQEFHENFIETACICDNLYTKFS